MKNERNAPGSEQQGPTDVILELELELERVQRWGDRWFLAICEASGARHARQLAAGGYSVRQLESVLAHYRANTEASRQLRAGLDALYALRAHRAAKVSS